MSYQEETYRPQLEEAAEYQDFITDQLLKHGIPLNQYSSRKYQYKRGESASGIEVKHDKKMHETGNLYIEVAEKSNPENPEYVKSGVYRDDGTWLYLIGDYERAFVLSKHQLAAYFKSGSQRLQNDGVRFVETPTSRGYLLPVEFCKKFLCIKSFEFCEQAGQEV